MEQRIDRSRTADLESFRDRLRNDAAEGTQKFLCKVTTGRTLPTTPLTTYICNPISGVDSDDSESSVPSYDVDTTNTVPVVFLEPPTLGDVVVAHAVGGRWVAERGGSSCNCPCLCSPGEPLSGTLTLTLVSTVASFGPFTMTLATGSCHYHISTTLTVPASHACPTILNVPFQADVQKVGANWVLTFRFGLVEGQATASDCDCPTIGGTGSCLALVADPEGTIAACDPTTPAPNATINLSQCPTGIITLSGSIPSTSPLADHYLSLIFGVPCDDLGAMSYMLVGTAAPPPPPKCCCDWFCGTLGGNAPAAIDVTIPIYGTFRLPKSDIGDGELQNCVSVGTGAVGCVYCLQTTLPYAGSDGCPGGDIQVCMTIGVNPDLGTPTFAISMGEGDLDVDSTFIPCDTDECTGVGIVQICPAIGGIPAECVISAGDNCNAVGVDLVCTGPRPWSQTSTIRFLSNIIGAGEETCNCWLLFGGTCPPAEDAEGFFCAGQMMLPFTFSEA